MVVLVQHLNSKAQLKQRILKKQWYTVLPQPLPLRVKLDVYRGGKNSKNNNINQTWENFALLFKANIF